MKTTIKVQNLRCSGCANTITSKLSSIPDISEVKVNIEDCEINFNFISESNVKEVKAKLKALGYPEIEDENSMISKARSFVSCATGKF